MPECFHKSETHLQLCLQQVGVFPFVGIAIGVLRLQAAFGIEPPLHAGHIVALFVILRFVFVEIIHKDATMSNLGSTCTDAVA